MHGTNPLRQNSISGQRAKSDKRRPAGVSRRRKRSFQFETLEARQVMSAQSPLAALASAVNSSVASNVSSYSSSTLEGHLAILEREMYWAALAAGENPGAVLQAMSIPTDPYLANQWHLINSGQQVGNPDWQPIFAKPGQDINVAPVWNMGYTGAGVSVAVIDSGVQLDHPDLAANIDLSRQFNAYSREPIGSPVNIILNPGGSHGTAVAGIIGAVANNGIGGVGVAPGVDIVPITFLDAGNFIIGDPVVDAIRFALTNDVDITNNSWGPAQAQRGLAPASVAELLAFRDSVIFGRDGLGMINVFASGNSAGAGGVAGFPGNGLLSTSSYNGYVNTRYTLSVTGVDHDGGYNNVDGTVTSYPEIGASVLVAAPTGSFALDIGDDPLIGSGIWTTDPYVLQGGRDIAGYNLPPDPVFQNEVDFAYDFWPDTSYTSRMNGTSAAAPMVTGVIALMLEANPNLSFRDVKEILIRSARQNAQFEIPQSGGDLGVPQEFTQSTWIVNQKSMFHDPDPYLPNIPIDPVLRVFNPVLNPNITGLALDMHYQATPIGLTNGAGYTISQGRGAYGELIGYAHGTIDAEMAVRLAEQWTDKNQTLAPELTFTSFVYVDGFRLPGPGNDGVNLPAREIGNMASQNIMVPGSLGGDSGFIAYFNEYFADNPTFGADGPTNTRGTPIYFSVPDNNSMSVENVEVKVSISGGTAAALDNLRITLISPDGTHSELNNYYIEPAGAYSLQAPSPFEFELDGVSADNGGQMVFTFSSNRSWGERAGDRVLIDPVTNEPIVNSTGFASSTGWLPGFTAETVGSAIQQGWQVHFENWGTTALNVDAMEMVWHGSPIAANSQRVSGKVGIDTNGDDAFNFSRVVTSNLDLDQDGQANRLGEVVNTIDLTQEQFAGNMTVTVRRTADGSLVSQFVTGHDGNYYFDLLPDDYTITVEDPQGRELKDDEATPGNFLRKYRSEWQITADWFRAWDYDEAIPTEVKVAADGTPLAWIDGNGNFAATEVRNLNFLVDAGDVIPGQAQFSGRVYADVNGDGVYNNNDIYLPNATVFGDVNRNGVRDAGEATALTDAQGNYTLAVPLVSAAIMNVAVQRSTGWTSTNDLPGTSDSKTDGLEPVFVRPGDSMSNVVFAVKPPANNVGGGGASQPGTLLGVVYVDAAGTGSGSRQASEPGAAFITVYLDNNNSGTPDAGDTITTTNEHGAFVFTNVAPGSRLVRIVVNSPITQITPAPGQGLIVGLTGSSTVSTIQFGVRNAATYDYGDLPAIYGATLLSENGARHKRGANLENDYWLGELRDFELDGRPSPNADGDDLFLPQMDEDGITFGAIVPGQTATIVANASRNGGVLQGWVDWNNDGDFNDVGERIITDKPLNEGDNAVTFSVPAGANSAQVYARFRYGEHSLNGAKAIGTPFGEALLGEVEDYQLDVDIPVVRQTQGLPADADADGDVDGSDFLLWQRHVGMTGGATQAQGDSTGDDKVNGSDLTRWKAAYGDIVAAAAAPANGDFDADGDVDGSDFLMLQRGVALAHPSHAAGDANGDGQVTTSDVAVWGDLFGAGEHASAVTVSANSSAAVGALGGFPAGIAASAPAQNAAAPTADNSATFVALASRLDGAGLSVRSFGAYGDGRPAARGDYQPAAEPQADAFVQRDRAFDDLFGTRRRQGLLAAAGGELAGDDVDCDDVFASLADHFERPLG